MAKKRSKSKSKQVRKGQSSKLLLAVLVLLGIGYYVSTLRASFSPQEQDLAQRRKTATQQAHRQLASEQDPAPVTYPQAKTRRGSIADEIINGDTTLMELPRLAGGNANYYVTHRASGRVNYSLEYDVTRRHARWVCFSFDAETAAKNVSRTNAWSWDPKVPAVYDTSSFFRGSGYSRGHLVASEDRVYSEAANEQTFYYTNMSPQLQSHNAGIWHRLERRVQDWADDRALCDVLYVAKGGTIADGQIKEERIKGKIVIPKYYWMAILAKKGTDYHAIAFWTEHRSYEKGTHIPTLTISVQELERRTGLDFFYHLPDAVERRVEAESPTSRSAMQRWWHQ